MDQTTSHAAEELLCRAHSSAPRSGEIISVAPGHFLQRQGDVIYDFTCPNITVDVREDDLCYREIPVSHNTLPYADPVTRILRARGTPRPCLAHFPLMVRGVEGWYTISPHIKKLTTSEIPVAHYVSPLKFTHQWGQDLGVLTESELRDWDHLLVQGHLREWTAETLSTGFCKGEGNCPLQTYEGAPSFSLSTLENRIIEAMTGIDIEKLKLAGLWSGVAGGYGFVAWVCYNTIKAL